MKLVNLKDERLEKYLNKIYANLGITYKKFYYGDVTITEKWERLFSKEYLRYFGYKKDEITVYKNKNEDEYLVVWFQLLDIDDYGYMVYEGNREISEKDIETLILLETLESKFRDESPVFTCWECGSKNNHILDLEGNLYEKLSRFENECCCE